MIMTTKEFNKSFFKIKQELQLRILEIQAENAFNNWKLCYKSGNRCKYNCNGICKDDKIINPSIS